MKKDIVRILSAAALALAVCACAKSSGYSNNYLTELYYEAWLEEQPLESEKSDLTLLGDWVYGFDKYEKPGSGELADGHKYAMIGYTIRTLDGQITDTSDESVAKQLGNYSKTSYYGPVTISIGEGDQYTGVNFALKGMRVGGSRRAVIPRWMMTYSVYDNAGKYLEAEVKEDNDYIYDIKLFDVADDIIKWQIDSIERWGVHNLGGIDSVSTGFYYKQLREPKDTAAPKNGGTLYLNYVGKLLNGTVFDTNVRDTAKIYNIYSSSKSYTPLEVTWADTVDELEIDGSTDYVDGFKKAIWKMRSQEKCVVAFTSDMGYGIKNSGSAIPAYSPLVFELEFVNEE